MNKSQGRVSFYSTIIPLLGCLATLNGATLTVSTTNDVGIGTLRAAILIANAAPGHDTIEFQIPGPGPYTISPGSSLPSIVDPLIIDGSTQPGFLDRPVVELNGLAAGSGTKGLLILAGNSTVRGLAINRFSGDGIRIEGNGTNIVEGNYIGVGLSGNSTLGNGEGGVTIYRSSNNRIGGASPMSRNIISGGNLTGIYIIDPISTGNRISGNYIGVDLTGQVARGNNLDGILIAESSRNIIGGMTAAEGNVISGNSQSGIFVQGSGATENQIIGNFIGTSKEGTTTVGNGQNGITISLSSSNIIGTTSPAGGRNLISGNNQRGVFIYGLSATKNRVKGNFIGTDLSGTQRLGNAFSGIGILNASGNTIGGSESDARNLISGNKQSGISVEGTNATGNLISGNRIGTDVTGSQPLANFLNGVIISGSSNNTVGGASSGSGNLISGNGQRGVLIADPGAVANRVQGNLIGTDATGRVDLGNGWAGVWIETAGNLIGGNSAAARNIISGNDQSGVFIMGGTASNNIVSGNFLGTDIDGKAALPNAFGGISVTNAPSNTIGGTGSGEGNLISGNMNRGIYFQGSLARLNTILGNLIGTDATGNTAIPNSGGIFFYGCSSNTIGGTLPGAGNLVSGNGNVAISIGDPGSKGNVIQGNWIGTKSDKISPLGNQWHGIEILNTSSNNFIGGTIPEAGNVLAHARTPLYAGIRVRDGCVRNFIRGNRIFSNGGLGIDLSANGPTANRVGSVNSNTNYLQNFPLLLSASGRYITRVTGALSTLGSQTFELDFYANTEADPLGYGEGRSWLGSITVTTASNGSATYSTMFTNVVPVDRVIAVTATDSLGNTSEFSEAHVVTNSPFLDSDLDGMPDEFEIAANLNSFDGADASTDRDGDGASTYDEFKAGTDPGDSLDVLRLVALEKTASGVLLSFQTVSELRYGIEFSTNLWDWALLPNANSIAGDKTLARIQDPEAASAPLRFYRVRLLP